MDASEISESKPTLVTMTGTFIIAQPIRPTHAESTELINISLDLNQD